MSKQPLAVITMVYNEPKMLPIWFDYYSKQVGAEQLFIIDHGSDDGSTLPYQDKCSIIRIPRSPHSDHDRATLVSRLTSSLLVAFDKVLYSDVDEIVVADPSLFDNLIIYSKSMPHPVVTALGMDVIQDLSESEVDLDKPVLRQRKWARPLGFLCKPVITSRVITFWNGFHGYSGPAEFDHLYLFHLALMDRDIVFERQVKKNKSAPVDGGGSHHLIPPDQAVLHLRNIAVESARVENAEFDVNSPLCKDFVEQLFGSENRTDQLKHFPQSGGLWEIPERFKSCV